MPPRKKKTTYQPTDSVWPAPETWKREVIAAMKEKRITRREIAKAIGCSPSAITILFREETKTSRLVEAISVYTGVHPPVAAIHDDRDMRWLAAGRALDPDDWQRLVEIAENLAKKN